MMASHGNKNKIHVAIQTDKQRSKINAYKSRCMKENNDFRMQTAWFNPLKTKRICFI
jgi:hypothetical protein